MASCRCGAAWRSQRYAHCSGCHQTFTTVGNFDKHRNTREGYCYNPAGLGMKPGEDGVWKLDGGDLEWLAKRFSSEIQK